MFASDLRTDKRPGAGLPLRPQQDFINRELAKTDVLYHAGDEASSVFRVDEGLMKLSLDLPSGKERILGLAGPGDFIGAVLPSQTAYQETSSALSPRVRLSGAALPLDGNLTPHLERAALRQLQQLHSALEDGDLPVPARLARTFLRLGERFGLRHHDGSLQLMLPLTHDHLAAMIGAARETTTATLGEMRQAGLLSGTRGRYRFQPTALSDFALASTWN